MVSHFLISSEGPGSFADRDDRICLVSACDLGTCLITLRPNIENAAIGEDIDKQIGMTATNILIVRVLFTQLDSTSCQLHMHEDEVG